MQSTFLIRRLFSLIAITCCLIGCKKEKKQKEEPAPEKSYKIESSSRSIDSSKNVKLFGKSDDDYALKYLNFLSFSDFKSSQYQNPEFRDVVDDSLALILYDIKSPQLMDMIAFSDKKDTLPYFTRVLFTPGDSIFMDVKDGKVKFSGKNEAHYNFFLEMNDPLRQDWAHYKNDPTVYKNEILQSYKKKKDFLENYTKKHPEVSNEFINIVGSELRFEYLYNLILPRNIKDKKLANSYTNNKNTTMYVHAISQSNREKIFDQGAYYDGITIEDFKRPELINNDYFQRTLILYIRNVFANQETLEYSRTNFLNEKEFIEQNLTGELKTYAISRLINDYFMKGFGKGDQDINLIKDLIKQYEKDFYNPSFAIRMNEILEDLNAYDFLLTEEVLAEKLLTLKGDTISFSETLKKIPDDIKVLDFWASWCGPCIQDFKESKNFKNKLEKDNPVGFLYLSIDEDLEAWHNKVRDLQNYLPEKNHYLIVKRKKSKLLKLLLIRENAGETYFTIPRYTILDKENRIKSSNAPRPSDSLAFDKLIKEVKGF